MTDSPSTPRAPGLSAQLASAVLFLVIGWALLLLFVIAIAPDEREPRPKFDANYSEQPLNDVLGREGFDRYVDAVEAAGRATEDDSRIGRFTGGPGFYRTEQVILKAFERAGLDVQTQEFSVPVPVTQICEILDSDGNPLQDVRIYPMAPGGLMPISLPSEGITAQLLAIEGMELTHLDGHDPQNLIVTTFPDQGLQSLASAGVKALIVQEDALAARLRSDPDEGAPWQYVDITTESSFPVFFATGPLRDHSGETITLRCKVVYESRVVRNLVGVLRGGEGADESIVLTSSYDSNGVVPDCSPGAERALSVAALLELVDALAPYRGQLRRDIVFVATAAHGQDTAGVQALMEALDKYGEPGATARRWDDMEAGHRTAQSHIKAVDQVLADIDRTGTAGLVSAWNALSSETREWFAERWKVVAGEINLDLRERALQARLDYLRQGSPAFRDGFDPVSATEEERKDSSNQHPLLASYIEAKRHEDRSAGFMGLSILEAADREAFKEWGYVARAQRYLRRLRDHHTSELRELEDRRAVRGIFDTYDRTLTLNLVLYSGGHKRKDSLAVLVGLATPGTIVEPQVSELSAALADCVPVEEDAPAFDIVSWGAMDATGDPPGNPNPHGADGGFESVLWHHAGYQAFTLVNKDLVPKQLATPEDRFESLPRDVVRRHVSTVARSMLALGFGRVSLKTIDPSKTGDLQLLHGLVYGHAGAAALVPSHPMTERTFVSAYLKTRRGEAISVVTRRGVSTVPLMETDPYGNYHRRFVTLFSRWTSATLDAARFDEEGHVRFFKDASRQGQSVFKNEKVVTEYLSMGKGTPSKPTHIAVFRSSPVAVYDRVNPQTLNAYKSIEFITRRGLTAVPRLREGTCVSFLEPDQEFYVRMKDGAAGNEEIEKTRAFMLNPDPDEPISDADAEIDGLGYLAADTPLLRLPVFDTAASMIETAEKRLALQSRYHMADPQMLDFQARSREWLTVARKRLSAHDVAGAVNAAGTSVAYAINNHPVIRERISHAVLGIIWYLALLVPFVLFFEKLVFGFADIRKQLLACGLIFLIFFCILRFFHPAFQIVRSSLMILLGFIMLLLTLLVTAMVSGKFKQNLKELRGKEGRVEGADVNRSGVVGSALALGLNNMRRRKVRTGLTCATLVFITFAMICFTSVSNDLVDTEFVTGRSAWNGITIRKQYFEPISTGEISNIERMYGDQFPVKSTAWFISRLSAWVLRNTGFKNLEISIEREMSLEGESYAARAVAEAGLILHWSEPSFSGIDEMLISGRTWFPRPKSTRKEKLKALAENEQSRSLAILPDTLARTLGIAPEDVVGDGVEVTIGTTTFWVVGIIDSEKLNRLQGLDGKSILPVDLNALQALGIKRSGSNTEIAAIPDDAERIDASRIVILSAAPTGVDKASPRTVSMSILFPKEPYRLREDLPEQDGLGYRDQRRVVLEYLERTGLGAYYAIDGLSYFGERKRARTLGGMLELLVPLLIAALTVFNTMRGSVYERREEIYVYNAVGIAPNHVFFMFMAEAAVYAVMGAMLGYILSQGMGRLLTAMNLTGGLNLDYSSIETIFASWAIIAAVLLSTILPARDAARLASPSGVSSWSMPQKTGDVMSFALPFTFTPHDRLAVVSYFSRWLDSNGEGSSGPFFCAPPEAALKENGGLLPVVSSTVWLKPYDLGVSQRMEIALPVDEETGEYIAHVTLTRISGNQDSWDRTVKPFLGVVRKQFLNWRATTDTERDEMFEETRAILTEAKMETVQDANLRRVV